MNTATVVGLLGAATSTSPARRALVVHFDVDTGLGILDIDAVGEVPFHCTVIADGSRAIAVGSSVVCRLGPAHRGGVEAVGVLPLGPQ